MHNETAAELASSSRSSTRQWIGRMVRPNADRGVGTPASFLAKSFVLDAVSGTEVLDITALGLYVCFINGQRVGSAVLTPGWTAYDARLSYQTYEVGPLLVAGENRIEIWLGDGWLRSQLMWGEFPIYNTWGSEVAALAELRSRAGDANPVLVTDASWESGELPIRKSGIYFGETFDARIVPLVSAATTEIDFDYRRLVAHETTPVRE